MPLVRRGNRSETSAEIELAFGSGGPGSTASGQPGPAAAAVRTEWTDEALIEGVRAGSEPHFTALYDRYFDRIYGYVYKRVRSHADAEEIVQETFIAVHASLGQYRAQSSLGSWIYGIARNTMNNQIRRTRNERARLDAAAQEERLGQGVADLETPEQALHLQRFGERVRERLTRQAEWQHEIFALRHFQNLSIREIVERTDRSSDAVRSSLSRMKRLLTEAAELSMGGE